MKDLLIGNFAPWRLQLFPVQSIRVVDWNIDRGLRLSEIADFLASQDADLLTLQEVDLNANRTDRRNIAEDLARRLRMNYVFGFEFQELAQGSRASPAFQGQATLSRWSLTSPRVIRFKQQSEFWRPRWFLPRTEPFQQRFGGRIALATSLKVSGRTLAVYNTHLESRGSNELRVAQLTEILNDTSRYAPGMPVLLAGDLNFDISKGIAATLIGRKEFRNAFGDVRSPTRPAHRVLGSPRAIDWALVSGSADACRARVHASVHASDHYPISFTLRFA
jgi:endonuclease/exonuclease/phosphatase family metal-dependent hydrolase